MLNEENDIVTKKSDSQDHNVTKQNKDLKPTRYEKRMVMQPQSLRNADQLATTNVTKKDPRDSLKRYEMHHRTIFEERKNDILRIPIDNPISDQYQIPVLFSMEAR